MQGLIFLNKEIISRFFVALNLTGRNKLHCCWVTGLGRTNTVLQFITSGCFLENDFFGGAVECKDLILMYLKGRATERGRQGENSLINFPNGYNDQSCISLKPASWSFFLVSHVYAVSQALLEPSSAFPGMFAGSWMRSGPVGTWTRILALQVEA